MRRWVHLAERVRGGWRREVHSLAHPLRVVVAGFAGLIALGTILLMLPISSRTEPVGLVTALFTSTSAVCVTGLITVDTATQWTHFGQIVIALLIQVGGFGVLTLGAALSLLAGARLNLRARIATTSTVRTHGMGDLKPALRSMFIFTAAIEGAGWALLSARLLLRGEDAGHSLWSGLFHSVSAFNNAGFSLYSDNVMSLAGDWWFLGVIMVLIVVGGIGFPVIVVLGALGWRPQRWGTHASVTIMASAALIALGALAIWLLERSNPATLGAMDAPTQALSALFQSISPRTAGFNSIDIAHMHPATWYLMDALMFVGGGVGGTAGGIKVTTVVVLGAMVHAQVTGRPDPVLMRTRIPERVQREAAVIVALAIALTFLATATISATSPVELEQILFEVISAQSTVGLSTGITAELSPGHHLILVVVMFVGRIGAITVLSSVLLHDAIPAFRRPEGDTIVG